MLVASAAAIAEAAVAGTASNSAAVRIRIVDSPAVDHIRIADTLQLRSLAVRTVDSHCTAAVGHSHIAGIVGQVGMIAHQA